MPRQTISVRLPLKGIMKDWASLDGDPTDPIRGMALEEFRDAQQALDPEWPSSIPGMDDTSFRIKLAWIDYENGVAEYDITAHTVIIAGLRRRFSGKTPDQIAADHPGVTRMRKPDGLELPARAKLAGSRAPPADDEIGKPNVL